MEEETTADAGVEKPATQEKAPGKGERAVALPRLDEKGKDRTFLILVFVFIAAYFALFLSLIHI